MAMKTYNPTSPSRRSLAIVERKGSITKQRPEKALTCGKRKINGRNNTGSIMLRHRGGGHKRAYRLIDFKRDKDGVAGRVLAIEYDPNRTCRIALVQFRDGEKRYVLAANGMQVGQVIESGEGIEPQAGNTLPLTKIPVGSDIHNVELKPGRGGQLARAAGATARLMAVEGELAHVRLPSGEVRLVPAECRATVGQVGNLEHSLEKWGYAGRTRHFGRRPKVRGMTMNPCDHPMGGGEGRSKGGNHPCSPTGVPSKGYKTRKKQKYSDKWIVTRRTARRQS